MKGKLNLKYLNIFLVFTLIFSLAFTSVGNVAQANDDTYAKKEFSTDTLTQMKTIIEKQEQALNEKPLLHRSLQDVSGDEEIAVIVQLSEKPVALEVGINKIAGKTLSNSQEKSLEQKVLSQQKVFTSALTTKGIKAKISHSYNYTFNGIAMKIKASELASLLQIEGVVMVEPDAEVHALEEKIPGNEIKPAMNTSTPFLDIPSVWDLGYKGQGVKVAVLDTGIDYNHPEFEGVYKGGYNFIDQSNTTNYTRNRAADDPYETTPLERPQGKAEFDANGSSFYTSHGTHVAGTIAAQGNNKFNIKGIAPNIELYAYRVLGAYGSGSNSGVIAGIEKAAQEDMDIINLSLGGSNNSQTSSDAIAINNAALLGVTAVIATGNTGPNRGTIGSPGVAPFAISVANSTVPETTKNGQVNVTIGASAPTGYNLNLYGWKFGTEPSDQLTGTYEIIAVPGVGQDSDYTGLDVEGKVALISRGTTAFVDKIAAAKKAGAIATIIHNNTGTAPTGVFLGDSFDYIPSFDMSTTDGNALRTALATESATVTFSNFTSSTTVGDEVNSSSSRGPANPNFDIKPDVSAPGTNIMSSVAAYGKENPDADYSVAYDRYTGTSMATPHVAGIAALLKSQHPDWTPFDIKVAIANTAKQLDVTQYDVFAQGAGRVQPLKAVTTEALAYSLDTTIFSNQTYENTKGSVTFGNVAPNSTNSTSITKNILVENLTGKASDYSVSVQVTKAATGTLAGSTVTVNKSNFALDASGESELEVTLNVPAGTGSVGNEILGYIHLTNGTTKLTLPFAANFGPPTGLKSYTIDNPAISPNGDGVLDSTTVRYEFHNLQYYTYVELWDALNQDAGYYGDGYVGYLRQTTSTTTGPKTVAFDGSYTSYNPGVGRVKAPDGVYTIDLSTLNSSNTAYATQNYVGPIYVKTTAPQIVSEEALTTGTSSVELSGAIEDSYIDWKAAVADVFGEDYDVNTKLTTAYVLTNSNNEIQEGTTPITLNQDGTFSATINGLTAGENKVKITVTDEAGNHADKEIIVNYDKPAPAPTPIVNGVEDGGFYNHNVTISFTEGTAKLNGKKFKNNTVVKAEGKYTLEVTDSANKKIIINFTIDKTAPKVTGVKNNGLYNTNVTISFNEGSAQLNGEPLANKSVISQEGQYTLVVTDAAGNATTVNFTINKTAPAAPTVNEVSDIDTKISGKTEAGATVKLYISNKSQGSVTADKSGNFSFKIKKQSAGTEIKVTATNKVGNTSEATTVIVIDKTAPETPSVDKVNTSSTKITGKAEAGATVTAKVGNTAIGTATADQKGKFSINISKQKSGTVITITATDVAGNTSSAKTVTVGK